MTDSKKALLKQAVYDLVFPRRCPFCGKVIGYLPECEACAPELKALECSPYRLPSSDHMLENLEGAAAVYRYTDRVRKAVRTMKYGSRPWYGRELGYAMASRLYGCTLRIRHGIIIMDEPEAFGPQADLVVSIPFTRQRRGYDSTALMAGTLAAAAGLPFVPNALVRTRAVRPQAGLPAAERLRNQAGSMKAADPALVEGKRVLLVDDVITTGATISEGARALMEAGAHSVFAVSASAREWKAGRYKNE